MSSQNTPAPAPPHDPTAEPPGTPVEVLDDGRRLAAVLPPLRRTILSSLHDSPDSAAGLARRLGLPRQRLNYHVRALERAGFVELAGERQRRGCVERTLRVTARAWLVSQDVLGKLAVDPDAIQDRFSSSYLIALAGRVASDVSQLRRRANAAGKHLPTLTLQVDVRFKNAEERAAFAQGLADAVARLASKHHDESPGSRPYRFVIAGHPIAKPSPRSTEVDAGAASATSSRSRRRRHEERNR